MLIEFYVTCPGCGGEASAGNTMFVDYEEGEPLRIDMELTASQMDFTCGDCGARCGSGDFEVISA